MSVGSLDRASLLLEGVEENHEVAGALVENAVSRVRESDSQLTQPAVNLRGDRKLGRWAVGSAAVQVLLYELVDLGTAAGFVARSDSSQRLTGSPP